MKNRLFLAVLLLLNINLFSQVVLEVDASQKGMAMSPNLIGAFFEDINYAADGGLYAEMVQNRSFEYYSVEGYMKMEPLDAWLLIPQANADAQMAVENAQPLNKNNTNYLAVTIKDAGEGVYLKNTGFNGIALEQGKRYNFSVYMRSETKFKGAIGVQLADKTGATIGEGSISKISKTWQKYTVEIPCTATCDSATLNLVFNDKGILYFDMVSLFPQDTYKGRENGLRKDLAQAIADLNPTFLRFPGGCIAHGRGNDNAYRWKETVGDVAERNPNWNLWGYHQTYGLGFYEYFQFCEDMGAMPLPVLPIGISCQFRQREILPLEEMGPWIQDALDLIEFANGSATSVWGKVRADMGHPEPFNMSYLCLGNEEDDIPEFRVRFKMMADTVRKYHPEIKIIGTSGVASSGAYYDSLWDYCTAEHLDAVDEHYYENPGWFLNNIERYDDFDRNGPKVFIGEYASRGDKLVNAIAEAAYLTGVEKNADIIEFTCYAPLLSNEKNNQWNPDLIRFDNTHIVKTASYYVQQLYSLYGGDEYLKSSLTFNPVDDTLPSVFSGKIGLGSFNTQAEFDDLKVVSGNNVWIDDDFSSEKTPWQVHAGEFKLAQGVYAQTSAEAPAYSICNTNINAQEYTLTVNVKKTGGNEGFLIPFAFKNSSDYYWLNLAGWANSQHAIEKTTNGIKSVIVTKTGSIVNNTWYALKIEVTKDSAKFYLDNEALFSIPSQVQPVTASVTKDTLTQALFIKMINSSDKPITAVIKINDTEISKIAKLTTLTGVAEDRNTLTEPFNIAPVEREIVVKNEFEHTLPANSMQVFTININSSSQNREGKSK